MAVSMVLCQKLLQSYFTRDVFTADEILYAAVTRSVAPANSPGLLIDEPVLASYMRAAVPLDSAHWALTGVGAAFFNVVDIDFPPAAAGEDWGVLNAWALLDSPDAGQVQASGVLVQPVDFTSDQPPLSIPPGGIVINLFSST